MGTTASKPTPGPWVTVDGIIYPANEREDGQDWIADLRGTANGDANAEHIVRCVNACMDIENFEALGSGLGAFIAGLGQTFDAATKAVHESAARQHDELIEALEAIVAHEGHLLNRHRLAAARAALAAIQAKETTL